MQHQYIKNKNRKIFNEVTKTDDLKSVTDKIMKLSGNIKGDAILNSIDYVHYTRGISGANLVEQKMKELGYPLDFSKINKINWYPESYNILINIINKELFNLSDDDVFEAGRFAAKKSLFIRSLIKYFVSIKTLSSKASDYWSKMFDFGRVEVSDLDEQKKSLILRVYGYDKSSISCVYIAGYFLETLTYVIRTEKITIEETTCTHQGENYHEYLVKWK